MSTTDDDVTTSGDAAPVDVARTTRWGRGSVVGMGTAVAALGVAELTSGIDRRFASPITQVGNRVIDAAPPWLKTFAIENFGTNDKQVLIGSVMVLLAIFAIVLGGVGSYIILKIVDLTVGVRVSGEDETAGLDISQHGEEGYNLDMDLVSSEAYTYSGSGAPIAEPAMRTASALEK